MKIALRPYELSDIDDFMKWACDDLVVQTSRLRHFSSKEDALSYFKETILPHPWYRAICEDGRPIGFICVMPGSKGERCKGMLSYALGSKYWNHGITTLAVKKVVSSVFHEFPEMKRVEAIVDVDNMASQRVLEKVGFLKEDGRNLVFLMPISTLSFIQLYNDKD
ncbi:GNAT domain [Dillenia turbinata]|uniref:GNAT domain n=1 Tax=Dillenia turbinata TaxID=194707 RepID=A0AAN8VM77_9MAGN